jgi:FAD/FMN-containing dehydrogenase
MLSIENTAPAPFATALDELARGFAGVILQPGDTGYDEGRAVWNGLIDRHPVLIARCASTADVVAAVNFAREQGLPLAVRGGGHNVAGHGTVEGGVVIDLALMNAVLVDPAARIAHVSGGATWGDVDAATQAHGLATPGGVFSRTGVAGLTLGGGYGWLRNLHGLSCDNLIGAEVVTAAGEVIHTSDPEHADLLWGLRGGGGNFGVVTRFTFQLHQLGPEVPVAFVFHDGASEKAHEALRFYREYVASAPDEVSTLAVLGVIPPDPHMFEEELHGRPYVAFIGVYAGPIAEGERVLKPLRELGAPIKDFSAVMPYMEVQQLYDNEYPDGMRYYWKSLNLTSLDDQAIDLIVEHARRQVSPFSTTDLWHVGGAVRRGGAETSAFFGRGAAFLLSPEANWRQPADDAANIAWVRDFIAAVEPFSDGSRYMNFAGMQEEGDSMVRAAFGPNYARLAALKAKYDPANLFRLNQNVKPST